MSAPAVAAGVVLGFASMKAHNLVPYSEDQKAAMRKWGPTADVGFLISPPLLVAGAALALGGYRSPGTARDIAYGSAGFAALFGVLVLTANR